jgi:hypothetical protein
VFIACPFLLNDAIGFLKIGVLPDDQKSAKFNRFEFELCMVFNGGRQQAHNNRKLARQRFTFPDWMAARLVDEHLKTHAACSNVSTLLIILKRECQ